MSYVLSNQGANLIKQFEGLKLTAYRDQVGVLTIGYGTTNAVLPADHQITPGMTITQPQADALLHLGVDTKFSPAVNKFVTVPLTQNQFDSLVCFAYNVGPGNLQSSSLLRYLNARNYAAAQLEFLKWNRAGGVAVRGLTRRRLAEAVNFGGLDRATLISRCLGGVDPDVA